jgi:hypothetical protein
MKLIANHLNGVYLEDFLRHADNSKLEGIDLAVAWVTKMDEVFELAHRQDVPLRLWAVVDGKGFPNLNVVRKFVESRRTDWQLFLTRNFFHPKLMWFRGVGAYVGSANLTDGGLISNAECGFWLPGEDLIQDGWDVPFSQMFSKLNESNRFQEATTEDLQTLLDLQKRRPLLNNAEKEFKKHEDKLLERFKGKDSPLREGRRPGKDDARLQFANEWDSVSTILRKMRDYFAERRESWPDWVSREAHPSVVQDQATEWWWKEHCRKGKKSSSRAMVDLHQANKGQGHRAMEKMFNEWSQIEDPKGMWSQWINEEPMKLNALLSQESLNNIDQQILYDILIRCHSSREHGRQISKAYLKYPSDRTVSREKRIERWAEILLTERSDGGHTIGELLLYVLWNKGASGQANEGTASRIWRATHEQEWKLRHIGTQILGECIGIARWDEVPPRNNRVSKALHALGFENVSYQ